MPIFLQYILTALGILIGISYGYGQWVQGRNKVKLDTVSLLKGDVDILTKKVEELTNKVDTLTKQNEEKEKKLGEALAILQNRNPAMEEFIKAGNIFMLATTPVMQDLRDFLKKQVI